MLVSTVIGEIEPLLVKPHTLKQGLQFGNDYMQ